MAAGPRHLIPGVEHAGDDAAPARDAVADAVARLTCAGGPSFAVLREGDGDDVQAAGDAVRIPTNGYPVRMRGNEVPGADAVVDLSTAFMVTAFTADRTPPRRYAWRRINDAVEADARETRARDRVQ